MKLRIDLWAKTVLFGAEKPIRRGGTAGEKERGIAAVGEEWGRRKNGGVAGEKR